MQLRFERRLLPNVPWGTVGCAFAIALLGIWNLASAARPPQTPVWKSQLAYLAFGAVVMVLIGVLDYRFIQRMAVPLYGLNLFALLMLRFVGHKAKGAESWFVVGPLRIQPAEFMKLGILLMLAKYFHEHPKQGHESYSLREYLVPGLIAFVPFAMILVQPDLGTALMIFFTVLTVFLFSRPRRWIWVTLAVGAALGSGVLWNDYVRDTPDHRTVFRHHLKRHQDKRISGWLDPDSDTRGSNYHSAQSRIAVGSGGLSGKGWKRGTQAYLRFLPEQHTDFVFSVWAEEHGLVLCLLLLALYGGLFGGALGVAFQSRDRFGAFLAVGVAAMLFWQVFENIGMVTGLLPVTGITLPLMSYGGSSLLSVMISLGFLVNVGLRRHIF